MNDNKIMVTNEEYNEILKSEVDQMYKGIQTMKEMDNKLDQYIIKDFDINNNNEDIKKVINMLCTRSEQKTDESIIYRGHTNRDSIYNYIYNIKGFESIEGGNFYSNAYKNDLELVVASYCEGDVYFIVCDTIQDYEREVASTIKFYRNEF